jgi:hypothetical protein
MKRTQLMSLGIILCVLGAAALIWQKVGYTKRETVMEIGSVNVTADSKKTVSFPPIVGGLAIAGGVALVVIGARRP